MDFRTSDLWLATALLTFGIRFKEVDGSNPKRKIFIYDKTPILEQTALAHQTGALVVSSISFAMNYRNLLGIINDKSNIK